MNKRIPPNHPLRRLFGGLIDQAFMAEIGICDPALTTYLTDMLLDFLHVDQIYRLRGIGGDPILVISRMAEDAYLGIETDEVRRNWLIHKHIGDFALFWTGVYPESLRRRYGADLLREYQLYGKRSYSIASELSRPDTKPPAEVFRHLGEQFEYCMHGLHLVREGWRQVAPSNIQRILPEDLE